MIRPRRTICVTYHDLKYKYLSFHMENFLLSSFIILFFNKKIVWLHKFLQSFETFPELRVQRQTIHITNCKLVFENPEISRVSSVLICWFVFIISASRCSSYLKKSSLRLIWSIFQKTKSCRWLKVFEKEWN